MKQIKPYSYDLSQACDDILSSRKQSEKDLFVRISKKFFNRAEEYKVNKLKLERIKKELWVKEHALLLRSLYVSKSKAWSKIKANIKKASASDKCVYCDLGEIDPIEHYLPKTTFPEYSILGINLFPCCSKCNQYKSKKWLSDSTIRLFLNFYFDNVDKIRFLYCQIDYINDTPKPTYYLDFEENDEFAQTCTTHFEKLNLLGRYALVSSGEISNIEKDIKQMLDSFGFAISKEQLQDFLIKRAKEYMITYGRNYWRKALLEALADSQQFLSRIVERN